MNGLQPQARTSVVLFLIAVSGGCTPTMNRLFGEYPSHFNEIQKRTEEYEKARQADPSLPRVHGGVI